MSIKSRTGTACSSRSTKSRVLKLGAIYTAFSEEELRDFLETLGWLKAADRTFEFWDNPADAVYGKL